MIYIATFYSHFGAIRFKKQCDSLGLKAKAMPVPRNLSSSCGTCIRFEHEQIDAPEQIAQTSVKLHQIVKASEELEQIVQISEDKYICIYRAAES